jgi:hypothetical protein
MQAGKISKAGEGGKKLPKNVMVYAEGSGLLLTSGSMYPLDIQRNITVPIGPPSADDSRRKLWMHPRQSFSTYEACAPFEANVTAASTSFGVERFDMSRPGNRPFWCTAVPKTMYYDGQQMSKYQNKWANPGEAVLHIYQTGTCVTVRVWHA